MSKLNQILSIEKQVKNKNEDLFTKVFQAVQKNDLLNGFTKTYRPVDENGEVFPSETKRVQLRAQDAVKQVKDALTELFNVAAKKDVTNLKATADVIVDGVVLLANMPATHLLFMEKKLIDIIGFIKKLPVLSADEQWTRDEAQGLFVTAPIETHRPQKVLKYNVVVQPTKEHPAQVKESTEDKVVGYWKTVKYSGALKQDDVAAMLDRAEKLQKALKFAREEANQTEVIDRTSSEVVRYIFG